MKFNNTQIIGGLVILVLFIFIFQSGEIKKESPVGATVLRSMPATAQPDEDVTITVTVTGIVGDYFAVLRENIPTGWTYVSGGQLEGSQVKGLASTLAGNTLSFILNAPSAPETSTFSGTYQFTDDAIPITTGGTTTIDICSLQASTQCFSDDEYWYDSCGNIGTLKLDCGDDSTGAWGSDYCSGLDKNHDRTNTDNGCSANACFSNPVPETATIETCTWRCTTDSCMRNSNADTDNDGSVVDLELLTYANIWLTGAATDIDLLNAAGVWLGQSENPVVI